MVAHALDLFSSLSVFVASILTLDTLLSMLIAIGSVLVYYQTGLHVTMSLNFGILSTGVVFPISLSIGQAFARREAGLRAIVSIRAFALCLFTAHRSWDWPPYGRQTVPAAHVPSVLRLLESMFDAIEAYCLLPRGGHARFYYTACGVRESEELQLALDKQTRRVERAACRLVVANEALKAAGLPSGECSRMSQYIQKLLEQWEYVRAIKEYRTPNAMRAFARVYILGLPTLFAPYFLHVALAESDTWQPGHGHEASRVAFACAVSATVSAMLAGLFSVELSLENPFSPSLDAVRVHHELANARQALRRADTDASNPSAWQEELNSDDDGDGEGADSGQAAASKAAARSPRWTTTPKV